MSDITLSVPPVTKDESASETTTFGFPITNPGQLMRSEQVLTTHNPVVRQKRGRKKTAETNEKKPAKKSPVREYRTIVQDSNDPGYTNRVLVAHPVTGTVRIEWVQARFGQIIPVNWSQVQYIQYLQEGYFPMRYLVADAQNIIVKAAIEKDFEWLLLWEHDVIPPPDAIERLNKYMRDEKTPVVSGLYYTRSRPSEPLVFRGRGTGAFTDWRFGDLVWVDGVPTGFLLIHMAVLRAMWNDAPEYRIPYGGGPIVRRIFRDPRDGWHDPVTGNYNSLTGTSDLEWCSNVIAGNYLAKAGWKSFAKKKYPFLVDTNIFCKHINPDGSVFP